jgi:hypothetical protein
MARMRSDFAIAYDEWNWLKKRRIISKGDDNGDEKDNVKAGS